MPKNWSFLLTETAVASLKAFFPPVTADHLVMNSLLIPFGYLIMSQGDFSRCKPLVGSADSILDILAVGHTSKAGLQDKWVTQVYFHTSCKLQLFACILKADRDSIPSMKTLNQRQKTCWECEGSST